MKTASYIHSSPSSHQHMAMDRMAMDELVKDDMEIPSAPSTAGEEALANKIEQPVEACEHCMGHSGPINTPVSLVSVPDQSKLKRPFR
jgi:hypothetical protein